MAEIDFDDAYANAAHIEKAADYPIRWANAAQVFRDQMVAQGRAELTQSYGPSERQAFDLFYPEGPPKGTMIFVHGGYWLRFDRSFWSHFATGVLARGWAVAMPSYDLCPDVMIAEITQQIATAVQAIASQTPGPITLAGHSAGGHLVSRMLAPGILPENVVDRIAQVVPISPVADLRPLMRTSMNTDFGLNIADAEAESPVLQPAPQTPVTVWVGAKERPAFLDQARDLGAAWSCPVWTVPDRHHFDIIDGLADPSSRLTNLLVLKT